ncbi:MAG TPA: phospholipid carrier-dependent glycosyltransferase [Chitinophagaceae bacterium]
MHTWFQRYHVHLRAFLFIVYLINGCLTIPRLSITFDEGNHYNYAVRLVKGHPEKIYTFDDASAMPISVLNTIPRVFHQVLQPSFHRTDYGFGDVIDGRYVTLLISLFIGLYVYWWSRALYGLNAALVSLFFFVFCPNLLAHATLVTTDAYSALFTIATLFHFWRYAHARTLRHLILFAVMLAGAQLAKQSLTFLYVIFVIIGLIDAWRSRARFQWKTWLRNIVVITSIQIVIINVGFQFFGTGTRIAGYSFQSEFFHKVASAAHPVVDVPLPLPTPYIYGLDYSKKIDELGPGHPESSPAIYILGQTREGKGFWYYYFVSMFFKTPVMLMIAVVLSTGLLLRRKLKDFFANELHIVFPLLFFLAYFDFFYNSQVGIRHVLMIFPLLHVLAGSIARARWTRTSSAVLALGLISSVSSFYFYLPNFLAYTNELIPDKKIAYRVLGSSNLDFNQASGALTSYLRSHPDTRYAPLEPSPGRFVISVRDLLGLRDGHSYEWLRTRFSPVDHLRFTYLIFDISASDVGRPKQ